MFYIAIWPILLLIIYCIVDEVSEIDYFSERSVYLAGHRLPVSGIFSRLLAVGCTEKACFGLAVGCTGKARFGLAVDCTGKARFRARFGLAGGCTGP